MQTIYQKMETTELDAAIEALKAEVAEVKAKGLALDMARGKPSPSQVDISRPMLDILNADVLVHHSARYDKRSAQRSKQYHIQRCHSTEEDQRSTDQIKCLRNTEQLFYQNVGEVCILGCLRDKDTGRK